MGVGAFPSAFWHGMIRYPRTAWPATDRGDRQVTRQTRRTLLWLAIPSALFVAFKVLSGLGIDQIPHRRIANLYGAQPGATVVLLSAFALLALGLGRVAEVSAQGGRLALRLKASHQTVVFTIAVVAVASLVFARLYANEYAWVWTF